MAVHFDGFSDNLSTAVKPLSPEAITDHGHRMTPGSLSLLRQKAPTDAGFDPKDLGEVCGHHLSVKPFRESIGTKVDAEQAPGNQTGESLVGFPDCEIDGEGKTLVMAILPTSNSRPETHDLAGIRYR